MSAINFPASPTTGQQYTFEQKTWSFNGFGWVQIPYGGQVTQSWYLLEEMVLDVVEAFPNDLLTDAAWYELTYV